MAEGSDVSDTAQSGHSPRAADVGDGVLAPTAGAEKRWGRPQSQSQFWRGEGPGGVWAMPVKVSHTLDTGRSTCLACRTRSWGCVCKHSIPAVRSLPALWLPVGSSTRPVEA